MPTHMPYTILPSQFNGISVYASATSIINGTFQSNYGADLYGVTPSAFPTLAVTDNVPSHEWSSGGQVGNASNVFLNLEVPAGARVFVS